MNIEGLNSKGKLNVSNPLTIKKNKANPSFSGHVLTQDARGNDVYKFNLPNAPEHSKLYIAIMSKDSNGYYKASQDVDQYDMPKGFESYSIKASDYNLDENHILGYKFEVNGKEWTDKGAKGDKNFTMAIPVNSANPTRPRQIEHLLVDSFNAPNQTDFKRNHFNNLGGTLVSANEKIDELAKFGIRSILGTPVFGQDNKSSHGYWTTNPYQITSKIGDYKDFRNLMVNMYSHGMSWVADGAFVNEGIEGVHIKDIARFGIDSPFIPFFETTDLKNQDVRFGILSKNEDVNKHTHIKLVNAPYKIIFEKAADGTYKEKEILRNSVDSSKPTYVQVFDDRLASEKQMNNNETFNVYDIKQTDDNFEIANYKDSVQAYNFKVNVSAVEDNYKKFKEAKRSDKTVEFKDALKEWPNFKIVKSNKDGGIALWVGNSDISKKRFILSESAIEQIKATPEKKQALLAAPYQVQDDTVQVGKFWTGEVSRMLTEYTARELAKEVNSGKSYEQAVNKLIKDGKISKEAKVITEKENEHSASALDNILTISPITDKRKYNLKPVKMPENITDGLMSYPLDAIEFSPDLVSIFAYPFIKNLAVSEDTIGKSRYDMFKMGDDYYNKMPSEYRNTYKEMDTLLSGDMTKQAMSIMEDLQKSANLNLINNGELTQEGKEVYSLVASDIVKFLVVSSLAPDIKPDAKSEVLAYDVKKLSQYDLNKLNLNYYNTPEKTAQALIDKIKTGLKNIPSDSRKAFLSQLSNRLNNVDSDAINVAKLIVERTESGLDWRIDAAKDVADWESGEVGKLDQDKNESLIYSFWKHFNDGVRAHNPRSYTIGELTDMPHIPVSQFLARTGFSTVSDYSYFYDALPSAFGQNDKGQDGGLSLIVDKLTNKTSSYFDSAILDSLNFAHRFVGNQDKPRILHLLAMDVSAFNRDKAKEVGKVMKNGMENTSEYNELSQRQKQAIDSAIATFKKGLHTVNGKTVRFDAENFGVRPFDYVLDDIINQAQYEDEDFKNYVNGNKDKIKKLKAHALKNILEPAMKKYRSILFTMVALPGTPTNYAGDEFGLTGWETFAKNEKQEDRNALRWDLLGDDDYKFIKEYRDTLSHVMQIRNKEAASALVNGTTLPLYEQKVNGGGTALALYRYNDKTDAIAIIHGHGYSRNPKDAGLDVSLSHIDLGGIGDTGLPVGTIYIDALNENNRFKVTSSHTINRIDGNGKEMDSIPLGNVGLILLREKDFKNKKLSFKGRMENPNVTLANTKYNFSYMSK